MEIRITKEEDITRFQNAVTGYPEYTDRNCTAQDVQNYLKKL